MLEDAAALVNVGNPVLLKGSEYMSAVDSGKKVAGNLTEFAEVQP